MRIIYLITLVGFCFLLSSFQPSKPSVKNEGYSVLIIKHQYTMHIIDADGEIMESYPVVFGSSDLRDKMMQGDNRTPEGIFHISYKRKHEKWDRFLLIDYPNEESHRKFRLRKDAGLIPANAKIGGDIGIHGTWPNEDFAIDKKQNWTQGCISTKNKYIESIFELLPLGTRVEIRH